MYANIGGTSKLIHSKGYLWYKYTYTKTSTTGVGTALGTKFVDEIYDDSDYNDPVEFFSKRYTYKVGSDIIINGGTVTLQSPQTLSMEEYGNYDQNLTINVGSASYTYRQASSCNNALKNKYALANRGTSMTFSGNQRIAYKIAEVDLQAGETGGLFPVIYGQNYSTITHNAVNIVTSYLFTCETTIVSSTNPNAYTSSNLDWLGEDHYNMGDYVYGSSNVYYKAIV